MLVAVVVRVPGLGATNLWLDEANSWLLAKYPVRELLANLRTSPGSPLYFLLLHGWVRVFGDSESALRALSLIVSLALVPLTYALGARVLGRRAAFMGTLLLAVSPLQLYFAQEARVYMMVAVLATACTTAYVAWRQAVCPADAPGADRPVARPARPGIALALYVVCAILAVYTLNLAVLVLLAINIDAALALARATRVGRQRFGSGPPADAPTRAARAWVGAQIVVGLACLPLVLAVDTRTAVASQAWRRALSAGDALRGLLEYFATAIHGGYFYPWQLYQAFADRWSPDAMLYRVLAYPLTFLVLLTALSLPPRGARRGVARVLYLTMAVPLAAGVAVSVSHELVLPRYFLFTTPMLYLLIGAGLDRMSPRLRAASLVILLATMGAGVATYRGVAARDSDYRPVARRLAAVIRPGDVILVQPPEMGIPLSYYLGREARLAGGANGSAPPTVTALGAGAPLAGALVPDARARTWLVLDYRARAFGMRPDTLDRALAGHVVSDVLVTPGGSGVRVVQVDSAAPR
jgi:mannosyltransferase